MQKNFPRSTGIYANDPHPTHSHIPDPVQPDRLSEPIRANKVQSAYAVRGTPKRVEMLRWINL